MQNKLRDLFWVVLACALVACGGGGGGGSSSSSTPPAPNGTFDLSTTSLNFTAATPISTVASQTITLSNLGPDASVIRVSSTSGGAIASWLNVTISGSTGTVTANPSSLSVGTYNTVVRVASFSSSNAQLFYKDVNVQLVVTSNLWSVYDAAALPDATGAVTLSNGTSSRFFLCNNAAGTPSGTCLLANNSVSAGVLTIDSIAAAGDTSSYYLRDVMPNGYPKSVTTVFRTRSLSTYNGLSVMLNLGESGGGATGGRMNIFIQDVTYANNGLVLWNLDFTPQAVQFPGVANPTTSWHTYQMTVTMTNATTGTVKVYVDGASTPVVNRSFTSLEQAPAGAIQNSIGIGDISTLGSTGTRFDLDWIVWTNGTYTPAQLFGKLPSGFTSTGY